MTPVPDALALRAGLDRALRSRGCQVVGIALAFLLVAALHRQNDGLWFQGDSPRHAVNGLFYWDLLVALPRDPIEFAVRYYARYPVINPAAYPPLFYILEGITFAVVGPSPQSARFIVLLFACTAGLYTMAWTRRWIGPFAGWSGAFLAFMPGIVLWSNAVMLNIPATALGLGSLYHFRRWLETGVSRQLVFALLFVAAILLTYYPGISVVCVFAAWAVLHLRGINLDRKFLWFLMGALCAVIPLAAALLLAPIHTLRHVPSLTVLTSGTTWTYYWKMLPVILGGTALALGLGSLAVSLLSRRWRTEAAYIAVWITALIVGLSLVPAKNPRYILLLVPAFVIAAALGLKAVVRHLPVLRPEWQAIVLAAALAAGFWSAANVQVPQVSGFREIAAYLRARAPKDAVLYDGAYDGLFGFYVRAFDPDFERRLVRADRLLYEYGPSETFDWVEKSNVGSTSDVVNVLRTQSGCRWVAIEVGRNSSSVLGRQLLRQAVTRAEFELVRSFPITGAGPRRVDLYRLVDDVEPVIAVDLNFPSFSNRAFRHIVPITR